MQRWNRLNLLSILEAKGNASWFTILQKALTVILLKENLLRRSQHIIS